MAKPEQHSFSMLRPVWRSKEISLRTKLRIFNTNVKSVLMYGVATLRVTKNISAKIQAFTNRCLRNILGVRWPNTISNEDLLAKTQKEKMTTQIRRRKWKWIGHTLRKPHNNVTKQSLFFGILKVNERVVGRKTTEEDQPNKNSGK